MDLSTVQKGNINIPTTHFSDYTTFARPDLSLKHYASLL